MKTLSFTEVCFGVALACNMVWIRMCFQSLNLYADYDYAESLLDKTYLLSIVIVAGTLLLAALFPKLIARILMKRAMPFVLAFGMSVSTVLMPLAGFEGGAGIAFWLVAAVISGLFSGIFLLYCGIAFALLTTRSIVAATAVATILASLLFCVFLLFSPFEACVFAFVMPLACVLFLYLGIKSLGDAESIQTVCTSLVLGNPDVPLDDTPGAKDSSERKNLMRLVMAIGVCSCLIGFSNEASRTIFVQLGIIGMVSGQSYAVIQGFAGFAATVGTVFIALALFNAQTPQMPQYCYRLTSLFLIVGVMGLPLQFIYPQNTVFVSYALNTASYQCFALMVWVMTAGMCHRYFASTIRIFAFIRAGWAIGPLAGILFGRFLIASFGLTLGAVFPAMLICIFAILAAILLVFTESGLVNAMNIIPLERHRRFREKCERVIESFSLSKREGEIMTMFAKGRNLAYIQAQLHLSKSTISTHRQHIYQKLNIHSAQELLDLIQSA
ncbi:MAG: helix-turn-helix transcriptional regulator [Coriobacteriales bacterium]|nr:helix-turn-helix transcriptional regulator [Coriobacteriales bacterium]